MKYYTGIGSRETPIEIMDFMSELAGLLSELGYTVRSGGADGADAAFYDGVEDKAHPCELWLPWKGFNLANNEAAKELWDLVNKQPRK